MHNQTGGNLQSPQSGPPTPLGTGSMYVKSELTSPTAGSGHFSPGPMGPPMQHPNHQPLTTTASPQLQRTPMSPMGGPPRGSPFGPPSSQIPPGKPTQNNSQDTSSSGMLSGQPQGQTQQQNPRKRPHKQQSASGKSTETFKTSNDTLRLCYRNRQMQRFCTWLRYVSKGTIRRKYSSNSTKIEMFHFHEI